MTRKQSAEDRQQRLDQRCCPIHGIGLAQISSWYEELDWDKRQRLGKHYTLVHDGRKDCPLVIKSYDFDGPHEMLPEWAHIMDGESEDELTPQGEPVARTQRGMVVEPNQHVQAGEMMQGIDTPKDPFRSQISVQWSDADQAYVATVQGRPDLPSVHGKTMVEAVYECTILLLNFEEVRGLEGTA